MTEYKEKQEEYKSLIIKRDTYEKEAVGYEWAYIKQFGELIEKDYQLKIRCIQFKKMISLAQKEINYGNSVDAEKIAAAAEQQMNTYYRELSYIQSVRKSESTEISSFELIQIKKTYREIVSLIHPDINPEVFQDEEISTLWNSTVEEYHKNNLKKLEQLLLLVKARLEKLGITVSEEKIENIDEKIADIKAEIESIITSDPYLFKLILEDETNTIEKTEALKDEINAYEKYKEELTEILKSYGIGIVEEQNEE